MPRQQPRDRVRFGIGEWYGRLFHRLTREERVYYAEIQKKPKREKPSLPCPFQSRQDQVVPCSKAGGVCSVRRYVEHADIQRVEIVPDRGGQLCTVCPYRFREDDLIYQWVSRVLLGAPTALVVNEVGFLTHTTVAHGMPSQADSNSAVDEQGGDDVGRIDQVLVVPDSNPLGWCALEVQAVYLSGASMNNDFDAIRTQLGAELPFPEGYRHPDYRSSGPKRLMPQLQIKVPTLRRWGKKMAVVVDQSFFQALAPMDSVSDISNSDILWFVVDYAEDAEHDRARLVEGGIVRTTLERAVEGLTAGSPVSKEEFERRILAQYAKQQRNRSPR